MHTFVSVLVNMHCSSVGTGHTLFVNNTFIVTLYYSTFKMHV